MSLTDPVVSKVLVVEIVADYCDRTFGQGGCSAARNDGGECYQTFSTCPVQSDYLNTSGKSYLYTLADGIPAPGLQAWRCIKSRTVVAGSIDQRRGLGGRDQVSIVFQDFPHDDAGIDPYVNGRKSVQGYHFRKWVARNPNYQGRTLKVHEYPLDDRGRVDTANVATQRYILDEVKFGRGGLVTFVARDILKLLDSVQIPLPTDAKLAADLDIGDLTGTLETGHSLSDGALIFRVGDEIVSGTLTGDALSGLTRAYAGTTEADHKITDRIQEVKAWVDQSVAEIWEDILSDSGIEGALIDTSGATTEVESWASSIRNASGVYISKPTSATKLIRDLMEQSACMTWWDAVAQLVKLRAIHPRALSETATGISDEKHIARDSTSVKRMDKDRITRLAIYHGVEDWSRDFSGQDPDEPAYTRVQVYVDLDAESTNEYGDVRPHAIPAYFLGAELAAEARAMAFRRVARQRNAPQRISFKITDRDATGLDLAAEIDLTTEEVVDITGTPVVTQCIAVKITPPKNGGHEWTYELEPTGWRSDRNYGFYHGNGVIPSFVSSTDEQRRRAYYANASGLMSDGSDGYRYH